MDTTACKCEHIAHTSKQFTPNGNFGHKYGVKYVIEYMVSVFTTKGHMYICRDCKKDCFSKVK